MYLDYQEYLNMGGSLDNSAFNRFNMRAEMAVNSQASGLTGRRISKLTEIPQAVKNCIFELISLYANYGNFDNNIASESQSSGGVSESYSYSSKTADEINTDAEDIITEFFYGGGIGNLLTRGYTDVD